MFEQNQENITKFHLLQRCVNVMKLTCRRKNICVRRLNNISAINRLMFGNWGRPRDLLYAISAISCQNINTVQFLNFQTPENFAVLYLKFKRPNLRVFRQKDTNGIANIEDPDQTAPLGAV